MKKQTGHLSAIIIFLALLIPVPLFVENRYFNIVEAKAHMLTIVCVMAWILIAVACMQSKFKCMLSERFNVLDFAVICAAAVALISCIFSGNFRGTFLGTSGWGIGGFLLASFALIYVFLSRSLNVSTKIRIPAAVVACAIAFMTAAHSINVDIFALHSGISESHRYLFKSTLGNLNAHVGYVCLLMPVGLIIFLNEMKRERLFPELLFMLAMLAEIVFGCTDSIYLGIGLCAFIAIPYVCGTVQRMRRTCLLIVIYGALLFCSGQLECFAQSSAAVDGIAAVMRAAKVSAAVTVTGLAGYIALRVWPQLLDSKKAVRFCIILLETLLLLAVLYFIKDTVLNFSDEWGTNRGKTWRVSLERFAELPAAKKLFGIGPEMQQYILEKLDRKWPMYTCHSEPIQILLTMGIAGIAAWAAAYGAAVYNMLHRKIWKSDRIMYALPVLAYLGQSLVNSAMATNIGIMCVALACYRRYGYSEEDIPKRNSAKKRKRKKK